MPPRAVGGRPPVSSRRTLEDAATELFLEQGYAATSIDAIARRAGLSRASVFNYVSSKSDLLWLDVDDALDALEERLAAGDAPVAAVQAVAEGMRSVPLVLTQGELLGAGEEAVASGMLRVARLGRLLGSAEAGTADAAGRARVFVLAGAVAAAWVSCARAGVGRAPLVSYLDDALGHVSS
jgi:AcrR family transcriptional regulator